MRSVSIFGLALAVLSMAGSTSAAPLEYPHWELRFEFVSFEDNQGASTTYELRDTPLTLGDGIWTMWGKGSSTAPGVPQVGLSPGFITLELADCEGSVCVGQGETPARLMEYYLERSWIVESGGAHTDIISNMYGEALGTYDGGLKVSWDTPACAFETLGNTFCDSVFCPLADLVVGDNPQNSIEDAALGDFDFNINTQNPYDMFSNFIASKEERATTVLHLKMSELSRRRCLSAEDCPKPEIAMCVPEPAPLLLNTAALVGLLSLRRRTRRARRLS